MVSVWFPFPSDGLYRFFIYFPLFHPKFGELVFEPGWAKNKPPQISLWLKTPMVRFFSGLCVHFRSVGALPNSQSPPLDTAIPGHWGRGSGKLHPGFWRLLRGNGRCFRHSHSPARSEAHVHISLRKARNPTTCQTEENWHVVEHHWWPQKYLRWVDFKGQWNLKLLWPSLKVRTFEQMSQISKIVTVTVMPSWENKLLSGY